MGWKRVVGKLLLIGAGGGCLALAIFVGLPKLTALMAPTQPMEAEAIIGEVLMAPGVADDDQVAEEGMPVVSPAILPQAEQTLKPQPLVARRHDGEEVHVLFPAAGEAETGEADVAAGGLPPVLTPEEVAAAMSSSESSDHPQDEALATPVAVEEEEPQSIGPHGAVAESGGVSPTLPDADHAPWPPPVEPQESAWPPGVVIEVTVPPLSATREVQAFLRELGYAPGPLDGIWGKRTEAAWRRFTRDAASAEARTGIRRSRQADSDPAAMAPPPDDQTPPARNMAAGRDEGRNGGMQTDLPPDPPAQDVEPVRVPGTLRGVMGYRLPLVSRQEVPDQVVSGVLIPAHTTFVVLRGGEWELVDLKPEELERLRAEPPAVRPEGQPARRGWNPLRLFRRTAPAAATE